MHMEEEWSAFFFFKLCLSDFIDLSNFTLPHFHLSIADRHFTAVDTAWQQRLPETLLRKHRFTWIREIFDQRLYSLSDKRVHLIHVTHGYWSIVFYMCVAIFTFCSRLPPTAFSLCLTGKCMQRLPVRMLLLPIILAPDLQGAEEESGIPRLLVFFLSQIHSFGLPAGGALGLADAAFKGCESVVCSHFLLLQTSARSQCVRQRQKVWFDPGWTDFKKCNFISISNRFL